MIPSRQTILIVEDERLNIDILSSEFCRDYQVLVAKDARQALKRIETHSVDLILLDIVLPEVDGFECIRLLKGNDRTRDIPVIFITSKYEVEHETIGLQLGAVDYIRKPFNLATVRARVKTHLELRRKSQLLELLASVDALTNLPNRRKVDEMIDFEWRRSQRSGQPLTFVLVDVDHFKQFNDNYGHQAGDDCLRRIAEALRGCLQRADDFLGRYGGEEFLAILPHTDVVGARVVAERLRDSAESLGIEHGHSSASDRVTISLGSASTPPGGSKADSGTLLRAADRMLFLSKEGGRNRHNHEVIE